ncbi:MAG: protein-L-isoaspartate O-methyltransferase [Deltaproteobacteria bacterium]|nr:protein-L-isoaspartate O-methyltransferase [Deltaproteobacteria bacterium]
MDLVRETVLRRRMVEEQIRRRGIRDERVLSVMEEMPRHLFVPKELRHLAYEDEPLPIGEGQTISQPYIVAEMTAALRLSGTEKVLEIGTGSGYQTAILSRLCRELVTIERLASLSTAAQSRLEKMDIGNVTFVVGDGSLGSPGHAPFDRILSAAASPSVPAPWVSQLSEGGIIVLPVGERYEQALTRVTLRRDRSPLVRRAPLRRAAFRVRLRRAVPPPGGSARPDPASTSRRRDRFLRLRESVWRPACGDRHPCAVRGGGPRRFGGDRRLRGERDARVRERRHPRPRGRDHDAVRTSGDDSCTIRRNRIGRGRDRNGRTERERHHPSPSLRAARRRGGRGPCPVSEPLRESLCRPAT